MSEMSLRISEAALEALRLGQDDSSRVLEIFRQKAPTKVHLPDDLTSSEVRSIHKLINRAVSVATVFHGVQTPGFPSVLGLGSTLNPILIGATGVLISSDILLTAAHVITEGGALGIWSEDINGNRTQLPRLADAFRTHAGTPSYDIGMIRLADRVTGVEIYPISSSATLDEAEFLRIVGFGRDQNDGTGVKKTAPVNRRFGPFPGVPVLPDEFVIGDPLIADDGDACFGDSGGPVLVQTGGNYQIAGLIRRAIGDCGNGTICPRLDRFTQWIDDNIQALGGQPRPV